MGHAPARCSQQFTLLQPLLTPNRLFLIKDTFSWLPMMQTKNWGSIYIAWDTHCLAILSLPSNAPLKHEPYNIPHPCWYIREHECKWTLNCNNAFMNKCTLTTQIFMEPLKYLLEKGSLTTLPYVGVQNSGIGDVKEPSCYRKSWAPAIVYLTFC